MPERDFVEGLIALRVRPRNAARVLRPICLAKDRPNKYLAIGGLSGPLAAEQLLRLASGGWHVVRLTAAARRRLRTGGLPTGVAEARPVSLGFGNRLRIETAEIVVGALKPGLVGRLIATLRSIGMMPIRRLWRSGRFVVARCAPGDDPHLRIDALRRRREVATAELDYIEALGSRDMPLSIDAQWHLGNDGQGSRLQPGFPNADVGAFLAWEKTRGAGVTIAVIDYGFAPRNTAFRRAISRASAAFHADGTVHVGKSAIGDHRHGAFCSAMAAGRPTRASSGRGVAPKATLLWTQLPGALRPSVTASAIVYSAIPGEVVPRMARVRGAAVISASFGPSTGPNPAPPSVLDAISFATHAGRRRLGTPFFWAVSHDSVTPLGDDEIATHPDVLAIGQSTRRDDCAEYNGNCSIHVDGCPLHAEGPELDMVAPGDGVRSTGVVSDLELVADGTSYATPCAAGIAALVLSLRPNLPRLDLENLLRMSCRKVGPLPYVQDSAGQLRNDRFGHGRLDAAIAVSRASR